MTHSTPWKIHRPALRKRVSELRFDRFLEAAEKMDTHLDPNYWRKVKRLEEMLQNPAANWNQLQPLVTDIARSHHRLTEYLNEGAKALRSLGRESTRPLSKEQLQVIKRYSETHTHMARLLSKAEQRRARERN